MSELDELRAKLAQYERDHQAMQKLRITGGDLIGPAYDGDGWHFDEIVGFDEEDDAIMETHIADDPADAILGKEADGHG